MNAIDPHPPSRVWLAGAAFLAVAVTAATPASANFLDRIFGPPIDQKPSPSQPAPRPQASAPLQRTRQSALPPSRGVPLPVPRPVGSAAAAVASAVPAPPAAPRAVPPLQAKPAAPPASPHQTAAASTAAPMSLHPAPSLAPAAAARPRPVAQDGLTAEQVGAVQQVDDWFNGIKHLVGNFTQIAPDGTRTHGRLFLSKPGKVRFQYAAPSPLDIVCDGVSVAVLDRSLKTQQLYPLSETPLRYLLKSDLDLLRDAHVVAVNTGQHRIGITIEEHSKLVGTSRLNVVFTEAPLTLTRWTITDPQGLNTTVQVSDLNTRQVPPSYFFAINYEHDVPTYR